MTPLDTAIYWIEYVLRHEGAVQMRNAGQDLNYWQRNNIDVFIILILSLLVILTVLFLIIRLFLKLVRGKQKSKKNIEKSKVN